MKKNIFLAFLFAFLTVSHCVFSQYRQGIAITPDSAAKEILKACPPYTGHSAGSPTSSRQSIMDTPLDDSMLAWSPPSIYNAIYMKRTLIIPPVTPQDMKYLKVQFMLIDKQLNLLNARYNILQTENERLNILLEKQVYSNNLYQGVIDSLTAKSNIEAPKPPDYCNRLLIIAFLFGLLCILFCVLTIWR